ncbi:hypothetical protein GGI23_007623, partial [Coemansia sp. RSA 2559]
PSRERAGDMHVTYWIQFPRTIAQDESKALAALFGGWDAARWDGMTGKSAKRSGSTHSGRQAPSGHKGHDEL